MVLRGRGRVGRSGDTPDEPTGEVPPDTLPDGVRIAGAWSWRILAIAGVLAIVTFLIVQLRLIVIPLLIAMLFAALLVPLVNFLVRHRWPKWLAIAIAELGTIAAVTALVWLVVTQVIRGFDDLRQQTIESYDQLKQYLLDSPLHLTEGQINDWVQSIVAAIQQDSQVVVSGALSVGSTLGHVLTGVLLTLFATLFLLIDGRGIWRWIVRLFPRRARTAVDGAGQAGWLTLGNFVRVQILVAFIDAVGIGLGAFILQVPLAIPIAVLVFLGSFVPVLGAVVTGALAVFIALVYNGLWPAVIMLGVVLLVQQIEGHVLQPLIMGTAVKVHPLAVVLAVGSGAILAGIPGTLFAVPVVAVANVMIKYIVEGRWRTNPNPTLKDVVRE
ncbi:AI-2E family transporter [Herbiconiux sp. L3-i23]|uniref:AI-2E family transporter n=1 Tax=Herbiconiux sp. L3-i23 TaxID=2905871 RepID=UPI00204D405D|nr:AI-2E family transporter [Herbiconiux sp. L3-i23]BDI23576.1 AI-2E family transporter [Herbiconiux sp. L3-i23]